MEAVVTMKQWAKEAGRRIGLMVVKNNLHMKLYGWQRGPHTVSFYVGFTYPPSQQEMRKFKGLAGSFSYVLNNLPVVIRERQGGQHGYAIQVQSPEPRTPTAAELMRHGSKLNVALGYGVDRQPVMLDFAKHSNLTYIGPPGSGKSHALRTTLAILLHRAPLERALCYIVARKPDEWRDFEQLQACQGVYGADQAQRILEHLAFTVLPSRQSHWPHLFVVVDDYAGLLTASKQLPPAVNAIAADGRAKGLRLLLTTQMATKDGMGPGLNQIVANRLVYKPTNAKAGYEASGVKGLELDALSGLEGDAFAVLLGRPIRCATGWRYEELLPMIPAAPLALPPGFQPVEQGVSTGVSEMAVHSPSPPVHPPSPGVSDTQNGPQSAATGVSALRGEGVNEPPPLPAILERRAPTDDEREQIVAHILARAERTSINYLIDRVYGGTNESVRRAACREVIEEAERRAGSEQFGDGEPSEMPQRLPTEDEELLELIRSGKLADQISAA